MERRHEVSDAQWDLLQPLIPKSKAKTGRPRRDPRQMLNGILWILSAGTPWRDLPERFGPWETVYHYFAMWRAGGVFDAILDALHLRLDKEGKIDWELWCVDGTSVRASRAAAGASSKVAGPIPRSRRTTDWGVREVDSAARSTSSSMAAGRRFWPK